jgi:hypothetical protein
MYSDFDVIYQTGRDLLAGAYTSHYPFPAALVIAALAMLEPGQAMALITALSLLCLVLAMRRKAVVWLFYAPVAMSLGIGQLNVIYLALARSSSPLALALLTTKPQLFVFELPRLWRDKRLSLRVGAWCCVLYGAAFAVRPGWLGEWLHTLGNGARDGQMTMVGSMGLAMVGLAIWLLGGAKFRTAWALFNPGVLHVSDMSPFAGGSLWMIPASWAAFAAWYFLDWQWCMGMVGLL